MGWIIEGEGLYDAHEGYAAYTAPDGRLGGASSRDGFTVDQHGAPGDPRATVAPGAVDQLLPWDQLAGWQAVCTCGWTGDTWSRAATIPGPHDGHDPDDAHLPAGGTVEDAARDQWQGHVEPLGRLGAIRDAAATATNARRALDAAVAAARAGDPAASWADIGAATGMSRQSAHERWGTK